jgi:hypothetical protein
MRVWVNAGNTAHGTVNPFTPYLAIRPIWRGRRPVHVLFGTWLARLGTLAQTRDLVNCASGRASCGEDDPHEPSGTVRYEVRGAKHSKGGRRQWRSSLRRAQRVFWRLLGKSGGLLGVPTVGAGSVSARTSPSLTAGARVSVLASAPVDGLVNPCRGHPGRTDTRQPA